MTATETVPPGVSDRWAAYPFDYKQAQYRGMTLAALHYSLLDARAAQRAWAGVASNVLGLSPEGWYADDAATILREIKSRK